MEKRGMCTNEDLLEEQVTQMMLEMGIPVHLNGFRYLRRSVIMCMDDMELVSSVTKLLYPEVAKKFKTTDQKVERAIRNAIEVSWERGNELALGQLFGYSPNDSCHRPTNSEYIAGIADSVMMGNKESGRLAAVNS